MTRGRAVVATTVALALINLGAAAVIAAWVGSSAFIPGWVALALLVLGVAAAVVAVTLWRDYLKSLSANR